jgi:hypothetical protein
MPRSRPVGRIDTYDVVVTSPNFESYGRNGEDVVLWRALHTVQAGRYVEVRARDSLRWSVGTAFYMRGWTGITIESDPEIARRLQEGRPRDQVLHAVPALVDADEADRHERRVDSVLRDAGWKGDEIHFLSVNVAGAEHDVLGGFDLSAWRPWILVFQASRPLAEQSERSAWERMVLQAGYKFCLFDGVSRYYSSRERAGELAAALSYPACAFDDFVTVEYRDCQRRAADAEALAEEVTRWRTQAMTRWASAVANSVKADDLRLALESTRNRCEQLAKDQEALIDDVGGLHEYIDDLVNSTSWRATRPLRYVSSLLGHSPNAQGAKRP